jgi:hypothetical protein
LPLMSRRWRRWREPVSVCQSEHQNSRRSFKVYWRNTDFASSIRETDAYSTLSDLSFHLPFNLKTTLEWSMQVKDKQRPKNRRLFACVLGRLFRRSSRKGIRIMELPLESMTCSTERTETVIIFWFCPSVSSEDNRLHLPLEIGFKGTYLSLDNNNNKEFRLRETDTVTKSNAIETMIESRQKTMVQRE